MLLRKRPAAQTEHLSLALADSVGGSSRLLMTVPKKLLARAVDRNQFRRIARDCWRARPTPMLGVSAMVRLRRRPDGYGGWPRGERARCWRDELGALLESAARTVRVGGREWTSRSGGQT
jgi:RNase P protein component